MLQSETLWNKEGPAFDELKIQAIWPDIEKIIERLNRFPLGGRILKEHSLYGKTEDGDHGFLKDVTAGLCIEKVFPQWKPQARFGFKAWWSIFGYKILRDEVNKEIVRTDVKLLGTYDPRKRRWKVDEAVRFSLDPVSAETYGAKAYVLKGKSVSPAKRRFQLARYFALIADEITARQWRKILPDGEALLIRDYIDSEGDIGLCAFNWGLSESGVRKKIPRICGKAWRAIRSTQDERLGLSNIPDWDEATLELKRLEREMSRAPQYARSASRRRAPSETWEPYEPPATAIEVRQSRKPLPVSQEHLDWGKLAIERDEKRFQKLEDMGDD